MVFPIHCEAQVCVQIQNEMINLLADLQMQSKGDRHYEKHQRRFIFISVFHYTLYSIIKIYSIALDSHTDMAKGIHNKICTFVYNVCIQTYKFTDKIEKTATSAHRIEQQQRIQCVQRSRYEKNT